MQSFSNAISSAFVFFPFVALFFTFFYVLYEYHKYGSIHGFRTVIVYSFILYLLSAYFLVILPLPSVEYVSSITKPAYNFIPFHFISEIFYKTGLEISDFSTYFPTLKNAVVYEAIFNVFLTVPFGVYLHYYFKCGFFKTVFYTFCLTLFFELTQLSGLYFIYPRSYRVFDVDDLLLNTFGGVVGYVFGYLLYFLPSRDDIDKKSYEKGLSVSFLRRLVCFFIDFLVCLVICFLASYFVYRYDLYFLPFLCFFVYLGLCVLFKKSVGMVFLNLKFSGDVKVSSVLIYYLGYFLEYFILPICLVLGSFMFYIYDVITEEFLLYILIFIVTCYLMVLVISFLKRLFKMPLIYEKVSKIEIVSSIKF